MLWQVMLALGAAKVSRPRSSRPVRVSFKHGPTSSIVGLISNPRFYEMTMGWPIDWTAPGASVTGFAAWQRRMRGELLKLPLAPPDGGLKPA